MALCTVRFFSRSLGKQEAMSVILPDRPTGRLPVLYLLHGINDDSSCWVRRTSIERYAEGRRLIVVMPDGHRRFYVNDPRPGGFACEDHIVRDVVGFVDRAFPTIRGRRGRGVAGLSMGGYGALMLALRHPEAFSAAVSHSGALRFAHEGRAINEDIRPLDEACRGADYDLWRLARRHTRRRRKVALRLDCGTEDGTLAMNRRFHVRLEELGIDHEYVENPGGHDWAYWDRHVVDTLSFVTRHLRSR